MNQRLHIGKTEKTHYDCVLESADGCLQKMREDWIMLDELGQCVGGWKVRVTDLALFRKVLPIMNSMFADIGIDMGERVMFYFNDEKSDATTFDTIMEDAVRVLGEQESSPIPAFIAMAAITVIVIFYMIFA